MDIKDIDYKLENLRKEYINAGFEKRKILKIRGRLLNIAKEKLMKKQQQII